MRRGSALRAGAPRRKQGPEGLPETWPERRMLGWLRERGWEVTATWPSGRVRLVLVDDGHAVPYECREGLRAAVRAIRRAEG